MKLSKAQKELVKKYLRHKLSVWKGYTKTNKQAVEYVAFMENWLTQLN